VPGPTPPSLTSTLEVTDFFRLDFDRDRAQTRYVPGFQTMSTRYTTVIEAFGFDSLAEVGTDFFLYARGNGPSRKQCGAAAVAGQFR